MPSLSIDSAEPAPQGLRSTPAAEPESGSGGVNGLQAVFWDMDGTLVDTEPYWIEAEYALVASYGGEWSPEQAHSLVGQALTYSGSVIQQAGVDLTVREIIDTLIGQVAARVRDRMPWRPGARELLSHLHESGVPNALVTMSETPLAAAVLEALPEGQMEFSVTGDSVQNGKPHPEAYDTAFAKMGRILEDASGEALDRSRCLAIEDSVPGTAAAVASGLVTLAVPHLTPLPETGQWHTRPTLEGLRLAEISQMLRSAPPQPGS